MSARSFMSVHFSAGHWEPLDDYAEACTFSQIVHELRYVTVFVANRSIDQSKQWAALEKDSELRQQQLIGHTRPASARPMTLYCTLGRKRGAGEGRGWRGQTVAGIGCFSLCGFVEDNIGYMEECALLWLDGKQLQTFHCSGEVDCAYPCFCSTSFQTCHKLISTCQCHCLNTLVT